MKGKPVWNARQVGWVFSKKRREEVAQRLAGNVPAKQKQSVNSDGPIPFRDVVINYVGRDGKTDAERGGPLDEVTAAADKAMADSPTWAEVVNAAPNDSNGDKDLPLIFSLMNDITGKKIKRYTDLTPEQRTETLRRLRQGDSKAATAKTKAESENAVPVDDARTLEKERQVRASGKSAAQAGDPRKAPEYLNDDLSDIWLAGYAEGVDRSATTDIHKTENGSTNKIFTKDAADDAREVLRKKLKGQLNSGLDPEVLQAGITLAGYHIESGARSFTAYSKAMIDDLGDVVLPYLRSWYEGVRYHPGFDTTGMTPAGEIDAQEGNDDGIQERVLSGDGRTGSKDGGSPQQDRSAESARTSEVGGSTPDAERPVEGQAETAERRSGVSQRPGSSGADRDGNTDRVSARGRSERDSSLKGQNYRIEAGALGETRGRMQKARDNVAAIELTRKIEAEGRPATSAEQAQLARYVGWGGLKGAFPNADGGFEKGFEEIGAKLQDLLTDTEYRTAQRSIQYAHYTSETIVRLMWSPAFALRSVLAICDIIALSKGGSMDGYPLTTPIKNY